MRQEKDLQKSASVEYSREYTRIVNKYKYARVLDDGIDDAYQWLVRFVDCLRLTNNLADPIERKHYYTWAEVARSFQESKPDYDTLRDDLKRMGDSLAEGGREESDSELQEAGRAYQNLAASF